MVQNNVKKYHHENVSLVIKAQQQLLLVAQEFIASMLLFMLALNVVLYVLGGQQLISCLLCFSVKLEAATPEPPSPTNSPDSAPRNNGEYTKNTR